MYKVVYRTDLFTDYTGTERQFIMAAVSVPADGVYDDMKRCALGVAVCRAGDKFDEKLGQTIAYGKALKEREHVLYTPNNGSINTMVVEAFVKQEAEFFKQNPGAYLTGYDNDKEKYYKKQAAEAYLSDPEMKSAIKLISVALSDHKDFEEFLNAFDYYESHH